jgi:nondiscriminating aspartyl-tRNA synthetase
MERTHIQDLVKKIGEEVVIGAWVDNRRDHGKLIFFDLRDGTGLVQAVVLPNYHEAQALAKELRGEWVIEAQAVVNKRPEKMINSEVPFGDIELEIKEIKILAKAEELPFLKEDDLNLDTYLDFLPLTLRDKKARAIFTIQAEIVSAFRSFLQKENFVEIQAPKLIGEDAEGGASVFEVEYFGKKAHLAQSPQFYKQIMVGVFERVFCVGNVYRAEKHSTTRHINEYTSLDLEFGFIRDHRDVMEMENRLLSFITEQLKNTVVEEFKLLGAEIPNVPETIPSVKLRDAQDILQKEFGIDCGNEPDLEPEHERRLSEYAKEKLNSEFIFVTHYPVAKRPMYTYEDEEDPGHTKSFDLLFRGVEITTGGQRVNDYETLVEKIKGKGLNPDDFSFYLQAFKYGMPPEGGLGMGLERLTARLLNLPNVKEATLFPRDLNRIDVRLSQ